MIVLIALVIVGLLLGVYSGMYTIHTKHRYFRDFRVIDIFKNRTDAWLYIAVTVSTSFCVADVFFISDCYLYNKFADLPEIWRNGILTRILGMSAMATVVHIAINKLIELTHAGDERVA